MRLAIQSIALVLIAALACGAGEAPDAESRPGLAIGERAPEFRLSDQNGNERALSEFLGKPRTALIFFRSADW
jgi:cytochrome oxidase Cu insertion factor (SCO1/SenC/PrrC family)